VQERINGQLAAARGAHRRFLAALPDARRAVNSAGGAGVETDAHATAQIALGGLQAISAETAFAVADLDALLAARSNALQSTEAVLAARGEAAALLREETATRRYPGARAPLTLTGLRPPRTSGPDRHSRPFAA
jgi:hypothetical protein